MTDETLRRLHSPKAPESYRLNDGDVPLHIVLTDNEYDGVYIQQSGDHDIYLPPKLVLWLASRVREYYPDIKEFDPCV